MTNVEFLVVDAPEPAVVLGAVESAKLARRRDEALEVELDDGNQDSEIELRLDEMLDSTFLNGMDDISLMKAEKLIKVRKVSRHLAD